VSGGLAQSSWPLAAMGEGQKSERAGGEARGGGGLVPVKPMGAWWNGDKLLTLVITVAILLVAWMVRFEWADKYGFYHKNRYTGVVCYRTSECWFSTER
jgi:hypothetical protein